ncbi:MAG: hypothetical protein K2H38_11870 [Muribaculaceae bacterium]|nr:hypothetical protein [Muribaculaceae bacterium]
MNYIKTLALALFSISILTSCSEDEFFTNEVYSVKDTEANLNDTKGFENDPNGTEPNDSTETGTISIHFNEPEVEDIDFSITIP